MSTQYTNLAEAIKLLQPTAEVILRSRPMDFTDETYHGFQQLLDASMHEVLAAYEGNNHFLNDMRAKSAWTSRMSRAVSNILRRELRGEGIAAPVGGYRCFDCGHMSGSYAALLDHKRGAHPTSSTPTINAPIKEVAVIPLFTPTHNIDLRMFPPGRFAVTDPTGKVRFFVITELKRRARLTGRFVWTKYRYANEYLDKGDRTVREQIGETKKYIGKQKIIESVYYGEDEPLIQLIAEDPATALQEYGRQLNKCGYCGRSLTDELSRERGIGPDCWEAKHVPYIFAKAGISS